MSNKKKSNSLWIDFLESEHNHKFEMMTQLISEIQVWLKSKNLYKLALKDIDKLKYFGIGILFEKKKTQDHLSKKENKK